MAAAKDKNTTTENAETEAPSGGPGRAIVLPSGERRIDYIQRRFYKEEAKRGDIARELTELTGKKVPYQIVFAGTKMTPEEFAAKSGGGAS